MIGGGILKDMLKGTPLEEVGIVPRIMNGELIIEINEEQLKQIALKGLDPKVKQYVTIRITNGKVVMKIRLW